MNELVELWLYLSASPLFGLAATLGVYTLTALASARLGQPPWANPVLWTVLVLAALLLVSGTPYAAYFAGAQFIHFLLGPAVVALGWLLWQRRRHALAAVFAVLTGLIGAVTAPYLFDALRVTSPAVRGFALGTASHGIGAARALQVHPEAGAHAGLAFALQALMAALLLPLAMRWL